MNKLIVITGPTAVGKTKLAAQLAYKIEGEIISADSRQVYKNMDIGTGKDLAEYNVEGCEIPYHLIDILEAGEKYFINQFFKDYVAALETIQKNRTTPILCGGSGLYIETALEGNALAAIPVNETLRQHLETMTDRDLLRRVEAIAKPLLKQVDIGTMKKIKRAIEIDEYLKHNKLPNLEMPDIEPVIFALELPRQHIKERIFTRMQARLQNGMVQEVETLLDKGILPDDLKYYGLEYRWVTAYVLGEIAYDEMEERLNIGIRQFAKRQMTWFRRMEKKGYHLHWLDAQKPQEEMLEEIIAQLAS